MLCADVLLTVEYVKDVLAVDIQAADKTSLTVPGYASCVRLIKFKVDADAKWNVACWCSRILSVSFVICSSWLFLNWKVAQ